jgi:glycosyltransferase involved in cell wall biosynthesis
MNNIIKNNPRITIVTSTKNCAKELSITAKSIRAQTYSNIQWIIADGLSDDDTLRVIKYNEDIVSFWISEVDNGIYDAWNKACEFIDGDWVVFLGAGDILDNNNTLKIISNSIINVPIEYNFAFGALKIKNKDHCVEIITNNEFKSIWMDLNPSTPPHSATFCRSSILNNSPFDAKFKIIGDKKFMLRHSNGLYFNLKQNVTIMDPNGISHDIKNRSLIWKENKLLSQEGPKPPLLHVIKAYLVNYKNIIISKLYFFNNSNIKIKN